MGRLVGVREIKSSSKRIIEIGNQSNEILKRIPIFILLVKVHALFAFSMIVTLNFRAMECSLTALFCTFETKAKLNANKSCAYTESEKEKRKNNGKAILFSSFQRKWYIRYEH